MKWSWLRNASLLLSFGVAVFLAVIFTALLTDRQRRESSLTRLCFDIDGTHSALAIEPGGERALDFGDKSSHELSVRLCSKTELDAWLQKEVTTP